MALKHEDRFYKNDLDGVITWWNKPFFSPHEHPFHMCVHTGTAHLFLKFLAGHLVLSKMSIRHLIHAQSSLIFARSFCPIQNTRKTFGSHHSLLGIYRTIWSHPNVHETFSSCQKVLGIYKTIWSCPNVLEDICLCQKFLKFDQMSYGHICQHQMSVNSLNCTLEMGLNSTGPVPWWFWGLQNGKGF